MQIHYRTQNTTVPWLNWMSASARGNCSSVITMVEGGGVCPDNTLAAQKRYFQFANKFVCSRWMTKYAPVAGCPTSSVLGQCCHVCERYSQVSAGGPLRLECPGRQRKGEIKKWHLRTSRALGSVLVFPGFGTQPLICGCHECSDSARWHRYSSRRKYVIQCFINLFQACQSNKYAKRKNISVLNLWPFVSTMCFVAFHRHFEVTNFGLLSNMTNQRHNPDTRRTAFNAAKVSVDGRSFSLVASNGNLPPLNV